MPPKTGTKKRSEMTPEECLADDKRKLNSIKECEQLKEELLKNPNAEIEDGKAGAGALRH